MPTLTSFTAPSYTAVERRHTIVIGAGQAGLAAGYELARRGVDFVILDAAARVGDNWRYRWDSLRLFTPASRSGLPGMAFPAPGTHLPDKNEVGDYLEKYADHFELPVRLETRVESLTRTGERYAIRAGAARFEADNVIVGAGPFQKPKIPAIAGRLSSDIHQLHSSAYRNPRALPDGPVLVVGVGNSGAQIALELAKTRQVWLAGRETGRLPRTLLGRDIYDWVWPVMARATVDTRLGRRLRERTRRGDPLIGIPSRDLVAAGIVRVGRLEAVRDGLPVCGDRVVEPSAIVWCTGFAPDFRFIDLPIFDERGVPRHRRGVVEDVAGLYFLGLRFQYRMTSALIGGVGEDAAFVAAQIASRRAAGEPAGRGAVHQR